MSDTAIISADVLADKYVNIYQSGGAKDIRDFLFVLAIGIDRGIQIATGSTPPAA